jgi:hypothetical protein
MVWMVWHKRQRREHLRAGIKSALWILLGGIITFAPWVAYNYTIHGQFLLTSTNGGLNLWIGNNPQATGEYVSPLSLNEPMVASVANWPEIERDQFFYARALEFIQSSPGQALELAGRKLLYFLFFRPNIGSSYEEANLPLDPARWLFVSSWLLLLAPTLLGLVKAGRQWPQNGWLVLIWVSQVIISMFYFAGTRFRTPLDGLAMIWAAIPLAGLAAWLLRRPRQPVERPLEASGQQQDDALVAEKVDAR